MLLLFPIFVISSELSFKSIDWIDDWSFIVDFDVVFVVVVVIVVAVVVVVVVVEIGGVEELPNEEFNSSCNSSIEGFSNSDNVL